MRSEAASWGLRIGAVAGLAFLHLPILLIFLYAFTTEERSYAFPPPGLTTQWFAVAWGRADIWPPLILSLQVAPSLDDSLTIAHAPPLRCGA